jgi:hypothetical protein
MQLFVTQLQPNPVVVLDRYWNALKMNAGDIEKLKGIYAGDFATLGSLSKIITRTSRRGELIAGFLRNADRDGSRRISDGPRPVLDKQRLRNRPAESGKERLA